MSYSHNMNSYHQMDTIRGRHYLLQGQPLNDMSAFEVCKLPAKQKHLFNLMVGIGPALLSSNTLKHLT